MEGADFFSIILSCWLSAIWLYILIYGILFAYSDVNLITIIMDIKQYGQSEQAPFGLLA